MCWHRPAPRRFLPLGRKRQRIVARPEERVEVVLIDDVLRADLACAELSLANPAPDGFGVPASASLVRWSVPGKGVARNSGRPSDSDPVLI